jgi:type VI protein secretion system component Hcp
MLKTTFVVASILVMASSIFAVNLPLKVLPCSSATLTNSLFLKIEGIPGDSQDKCHPNEIEPLSFQNSGTSITVVKKIDLSSPKLFIAALAGTNIPEAMLTVFQAGKQPKLILYRMKNAKVASGDQTAGSANREIVTLGFQRMETEFGGQRRSAGQ